MALRRTIAARKTRSNRNATASKPETKSSATTTAVAERKKGAEDRSRAIGRPPRDDAPNRSEFIRKNLLENPELGPRDLANLWRESGFPGELSSSLFYQVKARRGTPTGQRGRPPGTGKKAAPTTPAARTVATGVGTSDPGFGAVETTLDQLIPVADRLGDRRLADLLRQARRRASAKLV